MEKCKDDLERQFYLQMTKRYGWTKRLLANFIEAQTYEKYLLNQTNFESTLPAEQHVQAKLALKDEYTFDFAELFASVFGTRAGAGFGAQYPGVFDRDER